MVLVNVNNQQSEKSDFVDLFNSRVLLKFILVFVPPV